MTIKEKLEQINKWIDTNRDALRGEGYTVYFFASDDNNKRSRSSQEDLFGIGSYVGEPTDGIAVGMKIITELVENYRVPGFKRAVALALLDLSTELEEEDDNL